MATKRSAPPAPAAADAPGSSLSSDQALALVGMGMMRKLAEGGELPWRWSDAEDGGSCDGNSLRQRLELTDLALRTGAPLSTAEVTYLMGARPGGAVVERGGLRATRVSRNVWKLSQGRGSSAEVSSFNSLNSFNDGRRRFA